MAIGGEASNALTPEIIRLRRETLNREPWAIGDGGLVVFSLATASTGPRVALYADNFMKTQAAVHATPRTAKDYKNSCSGMRGSNDVAA